MVKPVPKKAKDAKPVKTTKEARIRPFRSKSGKARTKRLTDQGFQDHHILTNKNKTADVHNHEIWKRAGCHHDSRVNKLFLPTDEKLHPTRSLHDGRHKEYLATEAKGKLDRIVARGKREGWSPQQFNEALVKAIKEEKRLLVRGDRALNRKHRSWAKPIEDKPEVKKPKTDKPKVEAKAHKPVGHTIKPPVKKH